MGKLRLRDLTVTEWQREAPTLRLTDPRANTGKKTPVNLKMGFLDQQHQPQLGTC